VLADKYDVILIGQSLSGLITAALLARRGYHVAVLEPDDSGDATAQFFKSNGFRFPKGPLLFLGLHREGIYEKIFSELGLSLSLLKKEGTLFGRPVPPFQLLLPSHRVNFFSKWEEFSDELKREFPEELQAVRAFEKTVQETGRILDPFHHLPFPRWRPSLKDRSRQFLELIRYWSTIRRLNRISALEYVRSNGLSFELQKLLELMSLFFYQRPLADLGSLEMISLLSLAHHEVVEVREGWLSLAQVFISRIKEYRGEVMGNIQPSGVIEESGEIGGIRLQGDRVVKGRLILLTHPGPSLDSRRMRSYTMFFGMDGEAVPSAMMDHLLFASDLSRPLESDNFLCLYLTPRPSDGKGGSRGMDKSDRPMGERGLRVNCLYPLDRPMLPSDRDELRKAVEKRLVWLMPYSEGRIQYLGEELEETEARSRFTDFLNPSHQWRERQRYGTRFYTSSLRNLFLLPDESRTLAVTQEGVKSGWDLAQHLTRRLAAELRRR
jgi:phytoene dehydrogenase-like protein